MQHLRKRESLEKKLVTLLGSDEALTHRYLVIGKL
jgi:hypothetical protein